MRHGIVLFASDRGITPADAAKAAEDAGFDTFYVPEHTHIPVRRDAAHPLTGGADLPDDRYSRTLDPWVSLATAAQVTSRIRLATAVALPVESDPITLAKTIATLDHLSGGRVTLGAGFGWNTDELSDHQVPADRRRTVLREYVEAMRSLWTEEVASYAGEFVSFGPSWAYPKPARRRRRRGAEDVRLDRAVGRRLDDDAGRERAGREGRRAAGGVGGGRAGRSAADPRARDVQADAGAARVVGAGRRHGRDLGPARPLAGGGRGVHRPARGAGGRRLSSSTTSASGAHAARPSRVTA
jgi:probable F420-dependent oxidoreductase